MIRILELVFAAVISVVILRWIRETFRPTPPDDREPPEDSLVTANLDGSPKPPPTSIKLDLPKDPD